MQIKSVILIKDALVLVCFRKIQRFLGYHFPQTPWATHLYPLIVAKERVQFWADHRRWFVLIDLHKEAMWLSGGRELWPIDIGSNWLGRIFDTHLRIFSRRSSFSLQSSVFSPLVLKFTIHHFLFWFFYLFVFHFQTN